MGDKFVSRKKATKAISNSAHFIAFNHFRRELSHNNFDDERCAASILNLSNLIELRLNQNKLTRIPLFVGLVSLQTLEMANNEIQEISNDSLMALPQLTHLDLSRNLIHTIAPNTFFKGNALQKL